ncbi:30S ribosomal protein S2 [Spiroplasma endosymbiont of Crioceris asparagi]|uniref:30S ribosomal protein S2 n=1 Tax=Spiroplasma endosymbiont of Crioceris asparagi TaxID=3066286 RepID=UPI0030D0A019
MPKSLTRDDLYEASAQYGHNTRNWNPKMKPYIYGTKNKVHIIDLQKTVSILEEVGKFMTEIGKSKEKIIFVGTKKAAQAAVKEAAQRTQNFFVDVRWLGGSLTNMRTISLRFKALWNIENEEKTGKINLRPKKEQILIRKEKEKLERIIGGIRYMHKLPAAIFVADPIHDEIAVKEARVLKIPVIAICDTNVNPDLVDFVIPANDDVSESINIIVNYLAECYAVGADMKLSPSQLRTITPKKEETENKYENKYNSERRQFTDNKRTEYKRTEAKTVDTKTSDKKSTEEKLGDK